MDNTLYTKNKIIRICSGVAVYLIALLFAIVTVGSILQTSHIDPANPYSEHITFDDDLVLTNLAFIGLTIMAALAMMRKNIRFSKLNTRFVAGVMLLFTTIFALAWINLVQSKANGDSLTLLNTAKNAAKGNYGGFSGGGYGGHSYFDLYPGELGYVFFAQILYAVFGVNSSDLLLQIPNVIALDFIYVGIVLIAKHMLDRPAVTNLTAIMLTVCLQPMFITTYTYSYLIGLAFIVWAVYFALRFTRESKLLHAGLGILTAILGYIIRPEYMVILIGVAAGLILHAIDKKKWLALAMAALTILCSYGGQKLVVAGYAGASGAKLNTQLSTTVKRYAGVSESSMAPGWYNGVDVNTMIGANFDMAQADQTAQQGIKSRMAALKSSRQTLNFFKQKLLSQINEPSFQSVWLSQVREHNIPQNEKLSPIVQSVYTGGLNVLLGIWFNYYHMIVWLFATAGLIWMMIRRTLSPQALILPIGVVGGGVYHMLFEAKSQYMLPYFILLIPLAAYGLIESVRALHTLFEKRKEKSAAAANTEQ